MNGSASAVLPFTAELGEVACHFDVGCRVEVVPAAGWMVEEQWLEPWCAVKLVPGAYVEKPG
jgi:hypothetical protein